MSKQPEALRLAKDFADAFATHLLESLYDTSRDYTLAKAGERDKAFLSLESELRRLHQVELQRDELLEALRKSELAREALRKSIDTLEQEYEEICQFKF